MKTKTAAFVIPRDLVVNTPIKFQLPQQHVVVGGRMNRPAALMLNKFSAAGEACGELRDMNSTPGRASQPSTMRHHSTNLNDGKRQVKISNPNPATLPDKLHQLGPVLGHDEHRSDQQASQGWMCACPSMGTCTAHAVTCPS